jgi:hypothetical protein
MDESGNVWGEYEQYHEYSFGDKACQSVKPKLVLWIRYFKQDFSPRFANKTPRRAIFVTEAPSLNE